MTCRFVGKQAERVLERRTKDGVAVAAAAGRAGQVDDERGACDSRKAAGQQAMRCLRNRVGAQRLGDARRLAVEHLACRLGGDVTWRQAGAAGGQDEARRRGKRAQRSRDLLAFVGNDPPLDLVTVSDEKLREEVAALVLRLPARDAVGDGEDGRLQTASLVFSTSCTSPITIALSIAFAMS